ncbi:hypothetical protein PGT21_027845 [Puccinia graminis f. sp. tritici]|uniref:Uncharacterized protein n=1 Tax=Puccinia graminis f. sp. tritici TaxID=56615 RepID=A0A5B0QYU6_PUCGR|nr:hypothetical protein PGT21_027845 [Puccinia graminis f. sp. tritici]
MAGFTSDFSQTLFLFLLLLNPGIFILSVVTVTPDHIEHPLSGRPSIIPDLICTQSDMPTIAQDYESDACNRLHTSQAIKTTMEETPQHYNLLYVKKHEHIEAPNHRDKDCFVASNHNPTRHVEIQNDAESRKTSGISQSAEINNHKSEPKGIAYGPGSTGGVALASASGTSAASSASGPGAVSSEDEELIGTSYGNQNIRDVILGKEPGDQPTTKEQHDMHSAAHVAANNAGTPDVAHPSPSPYYQQRKGPQGLYHSVPDHHHCPPNYQQPTSDLFPCQYQLHYMDVLQPVVAYQEQRIFAYFPVLKDCTPPSKISSIPEESCTHAKSSHAHHTYLGQNFRNTLPALTGAREKLPNFDRMGEQKEGMNQPNQAAIKRRAKNKFGLDRKFLAHERVRNFKARTLLAKGPSTSLTDEVDQAATFAKEADDLSKNSHLKSHEQSEKNDNLKDAKEISVSEPKAKDVAESTFLEQSLSGNLPKGLLQKSQRVSQQKELLCENGGLHGKISIAKTPNRDRDHPSNQKDTSSQDLPNTHPESIQHLTYSKKYEDSKLFKEALLSVPNYETSKDKSLATSRKLPDASVVSILHTKRPRKKYVSLWADGPLEASKQVQQWPGNKVSQPHLGLRNEENASFNLSQRRKQNTAPSYQRQGVISDGTHHSVASQTSSRKLCEALKVPPPLRHNRFAVFNEPDFGIAQDENTEEADLCVENKNKQMNSIKEDTPASSRLFSAPKIVLDPTRPYLESTKKIIYNSWRQILGFQPTSTFPHFSKLKECKQNLFNYLPSLPLNFFSLKDISILWFAMGRHVRYNIPPSHFHTKPDADQAVLAEKNNQIKEGDSLNPFIHPSSVKSMENSNPTLPEGFIQEDPDYVLDYVRKNPGANHGEIQSLKNLGNLINAESSGRYVPIELFCKGSYSDNQSMVQLVLKTHKDPILVKQLKWLAQRIGVTEGERRWKSILRQINQPIILANWEEKKKKLLKSFEVPRLERVLKINQSWPTFYDSKQKDYEWLLSIQKDHMIKTVLDKTMGTEELAYRSRCIFLMSKRNNCYNWLHTSDLIEAYKQGLNTNLIIFVGDILQFGRKHWKMGGRSAEIPSNKEAFILLWSFWDSKECPPWNSSAEKEWLLSDPKRSEIYKYRYQYLKNIWKYQKFTPEEILEHLPDLKNKLYPNDRKHQKQEVLEIWWNLSDIIEWQEFHMDPHLMWKIGCKLKVSKERDAEIDTVALSSILKKSKAVSLEAKETMERWFKDKAFSPYDNPIYSGEPKSVISDLKEIFRDMFSISYWKDKKI